MNNRTTLLMMALGTLLTLPAIADSSAAEIEAKIEETGLEFSKSDGGGFRLILRENAGRTQLVVVNGSPESYKNADFVEIWSKAVSSETRPVTKGQMRVLLDGHNKTLGHWCLIRPSIHGEKWILYYSIKIPVSATADEFEAAIRTCSSVADEKENDLIGTDDN